MGKPTSPKGKKFHAYWLDAEGIPVWNYGRTIFHGQSAKDVSLPPYSVEGGELPQSAHELRIVEVSSDEERTLLREGRAALRKLGKEVDRAIFLEELTESEGWKPPETEIKKPGEKKEASQPEMFDIESKPERWEPRTKRELRRTVG